MAGSRAKSLMCLAVLAVLKNQASAGSVSPALPRCGQGWQPLYEAVNLPWSAYNCKSTSCVLDGDGASVKRLGVAIAAGRESSVAEWTDEHAVPTSIPPRGGAFSPRADMLFNYT